jgi:hypothetical protein
MTKKDDSSSGMIELNFDDGRGQLTGQDDFRNLLEEQKGRFRAKFKRDCRPRDPLFFDPDLDLPAPIPKEKLPAELREFFAMANLHSAMIFAQVKVGFFLSPLNFDVADDDQVKAWEDAIREFTYLKGLL